MRKFDLVRPPVRLAVLTSVVLAAVAAVASTANAAVNVAYQSTLVPVGTNVPIVLNISGGDGTSGADFRVQTNAGTGAAPIITGIDLIGGTIYGSGNASQGAVQPAVPTNFAGSSVTVPTPPGTVAANGRFATVYVNTSSLPVGGTFSVQLQDVNNNTTLDTVIYGVGSTPLAATLPGTTVFTAVVPEPGSGLLLVGCSALLAYRRRRTA